MEWAVDKRTRARLEFCEMAFSINHQLHFDARGRLDAEHSLAIPRTELRDDFNLDAAFLEKMVRDYFDTVRRINVFLYNPEFRGEEVFVHTPLRSDVLVFQKPKRGINDQKVEMSWEITGGFMRAQNVPDGGRFIIGAAWNDGGKTLTLYSKLDRYATRLIEWFGSSAGISIYKLTQGVSHSFILTQYLRAEARQICRATTRRAPIDK